MVECTGLENQQSRKVLVGSNPTASATTFISLAFGAEQWNGPQPGPPPQHHPIVSASEKLPPPSSRTPALSADI